MPQEVAVSRLHVINKDKGAQPSIGNLRPIMISSPLRKLMEATILPELEQKLVAKGLISKSQTGFMPGCGTSVNLVKSVGELIAIRDGKATRGKYYTVFIDFKAAFDSVRHEVVYKKLEEAGIEECMINRIKFLYNHAFFSYGKSSVAPINVGVHQGSLISPILFNLYINDLLGELGRLLGDANIYCYADDLMFVVMGKMYLGGALQLIQEWGDKNGMKINHKKCGVMAIQRGERHEVDQQLNGINFVNQYKYLGVLMDYRLSFEPQIDQLKKRLFSTYSCFYKLISKVVGVKLRLEIWKVYVKTVMEYGVEIFALMPSKMCKLEAIFLRTLKVTLCLPKNTSGDEVIKSACILDARTMAYIRFVKTYIKMTKREMKVPELVKGRIKVVLRAVGMDETAMDDIQEYSRVCARQWSRRYWRRPVEDLNFPEGLFRIGQVGDWDLLYTLVGRVIPKLYEKVLCAQCGVVRDQAHILNECARHDEVRSMFRGKLMKLGIRAGEIKDISGWIREIQTDPIVRLLEKARKEELVATICEYLKVTRAEYLS